MALDLYSGGLARFYSLTWENCVQKQARETGRKYQRITPAGSPPIPGWQEVQPAITSWLEALNVGLKDHIPAPFSWDESEKAGYATDRPGYDGWSAFRMLAAYTQAAREIPERLPEDAIADEVVSEQAVPSQGQPFRAILSANLWVPGDFPFSFDFCDPTGEKAHIASSSKLLDEILELNAQTLKADLMNPASLQVDFASGRTRDLAVWGMSVFARVADFSKNNGLPILFSM